MWRIPWCVQRMGCEVVASVRVGVLSEILRVVGFGT